MLDDVKKKQAHRKTFANKKEFHAKQCEVKIYIQIIRNHRERERNTLSEVDWPSAFKRVSVCFLYFSIFSSLVRCLSYTHRDTHIYTNTNTYLKWCVQQ